MKLQRPSRKAVDVNITPLIDVVFLLLIFFMVSTTFTQESQLEIDLPEATGEARQNEKTLIDIIIDTQGKISINGKSLINVQIHTVKKALKALNLKTLDIPLIITADAQSPYQSIITVMDAAGQIGFYNIRMATKKPNKH